MQYHPEPPPQPRRRLLIGPQEYLDHQPIEVRSLQMWNRPDWTIYRPYANWQQSHQTGNHQARQRHAEYLKLLEEWRRSENDSLGFFPQSSYDAGIRRDRIIACVPRGGEKPVGFCYFSIIADFCSIFQIYVRPEFRKRGGAREMLRWIAAYPDKNYERSKPFTLFKFKVRSDLEAIGFWNHIGPAPIFEAPSLHKSAKQTSYYVVPRKDYQ